MPAAGQKREDLAASPMRGKCGDGAGGGNAGKQEKVGEKQQKQTAAQGEKAAQQQQKEKAAAAAPGQQQQQKQQKQQQEGGDVQKQKSEKGKGGVEEEKKKQQQQKVEKQKEDEEKQKQQQQLLQQNKEQPPAEKKKQQQQQKQQQQKQQQQKQEGKEGTKEEDEGDKKQESMSTTVATAVAEDDDIESEEGESKEGEEEGGGGGAAAAGKKKKKKKKKKSAAAKAAAAAAAADGDASTAATAAAAAPPAQDGQAAGILKGGAAADAAAAAATENSNTLRKLGTWKSLPKGQTWPPTQPMRRLYPPDQFPTGEIKQPINTKKGTAAAEQRESMREQQVDLSAIREAAECHRQVRRYIQGVARPGIPLITLCEKLEAKTRELLGCPPFGSHAAKGGGGGGGGTNNSSNSNSNSSSSINGSSSSADASPLERGWGFPTGCSINNCAAHYTPNPGDKRILEKDDICKLDFGVQVKGRIIDCAFSIAFDEIYDPLIQATQDGTNTGLSHAGVDARLSEIGGYIQEAIESYEMEIDGKMHPIKAIRNLTGHSIDLYKIHAGKSVPIVKNSASACGGVSNAPSNRMEEGEVYAIECFASTGRAIVLDDGECSHYMRNSDFGFAPLRLKSAKDLLKVIDENFGTLAFCRRWLEDLGCTHHLLALKQLVEKQIITPYPPLSDVKRSFTSQMEHTVFIGTNSVEVVSRGDDY